MSDQVNKTEGEDIDILCARVRRLTAQSNQLTAKRKRKQRITAVLGTLLAVVSAFSLSGLTSMTSRLDAEAIAQISRQHIESRLPSARIQVQNYLEQEAPRIASDTLRSMLDTVPRLRSFVFKGLTAKLDELNFEFERNTIETMSVFVMESKHDIDTAFPNLSDREKANRLVEAVAERFKETIKDSVISLYPEYQNEMNRVVTHLDILENTDPALLTSEQKIHKEIIQTLLQLLERRQTADRATPKR